MGGVPLRGRPRSPHQIGALPEQAAVRGCRPAATLFGAPGTALGRTLAGLDIEGLRWARGRLRAWAAEGRTVVICGERAGEIAGTADRLVVLGRGRLVTVASAGGFAARRVTSRVVARTPRGAEPAAVLTGAGAEA